MLIRAGLPDQLASGGINSVEVSDDVAKIGGGGAIGSALAKCNPSADFGARGVGPPNTAGLEVKGVDGTILLPTNTAPMAIVGWDLARVEAGKPKLHFNSRASICDRSKPASSGET